MGHHGSRIRLVALTGLATITRPVVGPLRPAFSLRYDRILGGPCAPAAPCLPDRSVWSLSAGLSWMAPAG